MLAGALKKACEPGLDKADIYRLQVMGTTDRSLRIVFKHNVNPRIREEAAATPRVPYTVKSEYERAIDCAGTVKLAKLIKIVGDLLQVKAYLFWEKKEEDLR